MIPKIEASFKSTVETVGGLTCWLMLPLMLLIVFDVVGRRFLSLPTVMLQELQWYLHGIILLLTIGFGYLQNIHVRIDVLTGKFSESIKIKIELAGILLFILPYFGMLLFLSVGFVTTSFNSMETSSAAQGLSNRWIIKAFLPVGFALVIISAVGVGLGLLRQLGSPGGPKEHEKKDGGASS